MKRVFAVLLGIIILSSFKIYPQIQNQALIFSVDVSKSMLNPSGFYNKLKEQIKTFIRNDVQINDLVTIYSFGDNVGIISDGINFKVKGTQDIEKLIQFVDRLNPNDNKTYLSKAIDIVANQMNDLQNQFKDMPIKAFLFTDGKNDPPTGSSSLSLMDILNKHKAVFKNPYTYTYIITLGTKLDSELQSVVNDPKGGIAEIPGDKFSGRSEVKIIQYDKNIKIKPGDKVNLVFQFLSIQNVSDGSFHFNKLAGDIGRLSDREINFTSSSVGKKFSLPLEVDSTIKNGKFNLRYSITPIRGNFEIIPKEIYLDIEIEQQSIRLNQDTLILNEVTKGGKLEIEIKGNNPTSNDIAVIPFLEPQDNKLIFKDEKVVLKKGEFKSNLRYELNPIQIGDYYYSLTLHPINSDIEINKTIPIKLRITEPFNWSTIITIMIVLLIIFVVGGGIYLLFHIINKEFSKYTVSGMGLKKEPLNNFKKNYKTKITIGTDIFSDVIGEKVVTIKANIKTPIDKKLFLEWHGNEENVQPREVLNFTSLCDMRVLFNRKYQFEIEKI